MTPMENNAQSREEAIFDAAVALPPAERAAYLDRACGGDQPLRQRVDLLLRSHQQATDFLEPAVAAATNRTMTISVSPSEKAGDVIGPYKIREKLGEGGWGIVYV